MSKTKKSQRATKNHSPEVKAALATFIPFGTKEYQDYPGKVDQYFFIYTNKTRPTKCDECKANIDTTDAFTECAICTSVWCDYQCADEQTSFIKDGIEYYICSDCFELYDEDNDQIVYRLYQDFVTRNGRAAETSKKRKTRDSDSATTKDDDETPAAKRAKYLEAAAKPPQISPNDSDALCRVIAGQLEVAMPNINYPTIEAFCKADPAWAWRFFQYLHARVPHERHPVDPVMLAFMNICNELHKYNPTKAAQK